MKRILVTGAAGGLGSILRSGLAGFAETLRLSDREPLGEARDGEEIVACDLSDAGAVHDLVKGCDAIVHLGAKSVEGTFEEILASNIRGTYNIYEAARKNGRPRIVFASSNHAIGFHKRETALGGSAPHRPDSVYGLSKCFGEDLASYYWDKFQVETVSVRIGSCFEKPRDRRMLATWLSPDDFTCLVRRCLEAARVAHTVVYGASANREQWWDNTHAGFLGWTPKDSSERFRAEIEASTPVPDPLDPAIAYHGGGFAKAGHFED